MVSKFYLINAEYVALGWVLVALFMLSVIEIYHCFVP